MPFWPCTATKLTRWPSARLLKPVPWIERKCTNRSGPLSGVMNPKPFASLNHLTVPFWRFAMTLIPATRNNEIRDPGTSRTETEVGKEKARWRWSESYDRPHQVTVHSDPVKHSAGTIQGIAPRSESAEAIRSGSGFGAARQRG